MGINIYQPILKLRLLDLITPKYFSDTRLSLGLSVTDLAYILDLPEESIIEIEDDKQTIYEDKRKYLNFCLYAGEHLLTESMNILWKGKRIPIGIIKSGYESSKHGEGDTLQALEEER